MTTIAWKDGVLAADSMASDDSCAVFVRKAIRLQTGDVAGGAGELHEVVSALAWLNSGKETEPPSIASSSIIFTVEGRPYLANAAWPGAAIKGPCAIGSGSQGALVAMLRFGASAEQAVASVSGIDTCTGGEIDVLAYEAPKRRNRGRK